MKTGISYGDPIGGIGAAAAAVSGLIQRRRTGNGQFIDLSQREVMSTMIGEAFMGWAMNQRLPSQMGNGHDWMAPHNAYPCSGEDEWVAITVRDDAEWDGLRAAMDDPAWASDGAYADQMARWEHRAALDEQLVGWTQAHTKHDVFERCRAPRVPAAPVQKMLEVIHDPHLEARGFYEPVQNDEVNASIALPVVGEHPLYIAMEDIPGEFLTVQIQDVPDTASVVIGDDSASVVFSGSPGDIVVYQGPLPMAGDGRLKRREGLLIEPVHAPGQVPCVPVKTQSTNESV